MTSEARFERQLPAILEDLYLGPSPDYRDEVLTTGMVLVVMSMGSHLPGKVQAGRCRRALATARTSSR